MADENKVSGKAGLDTTDFKTNVAGMNRDLRVLESGFRASAASLGDWSESATGLELRVKSLSSQMEVQQKKVAATRAEYERIKAEKGETSRAAQDLEIKLNKETETLGKMENELNQDTEALKAMKEGEEEAGDAADDMGDDVEASGEKVDGMQTILAALGSVIGIAVAALAALGAAAVGAVSAIADLVLNASEAGSAIQDMSDKTGIETERLQELQFIGDQTGVSLDTITGANARLIRSMSSAVDQSEAYADNVEKLMDDGKSFAEATEIAGEKLGDTAKAFATLGVATRDTNGNLRDNQAVFADTIDALGKIQNPTERDALAMQIFGKSAQELNPLIKLGASGMAEMSDQAHKLGAVMSEESVAALDEFDDTLSGLKDGLKGTLGTLATAFLPVAQKLAEVFQEQVIPAIQKFVALAGKELEPVMEFIVSVIDQFASGDVRGGLAKLFGVENADAILNLANIVKDFIQNTLLPFFSTHQGDFQDTFQRIVGGIIAIATVITRLAIAWQTGWFRIHDILSPIWDGFLRPIFTQLFEWLSGHLPSAIQGLSDFWTNTLLPAVQTVWEFLQTNLFPVLQLIGDFIGAVFVSSLQNLSATWQNVLLPAIQAVWAFLQESIFPLMQAIGLFIDAVFNLSLRVLAGLWQNVLLPALQGIYTFLDANVFPIFRTIGEYISNTFQPIIEYLASFISSNLEPAFNGIVSAIQTAVTWITNLASSINNLTLPAWLTPGSPTPWELGLIGINDAMHDLNNHLPVMARNLDRLNLSGAPAGVSSGAGGSVQNDQFQFFAPVIVQGDTPSGSLAAQLKGRRF